jgi:hypothetical protein
MFDKLLAGFSTIRNSTEKDINPSLGNTPFVQKQKKIFKLKYGNIYLEYNNVRGG